MLIRTLLQKVNKIKELSLKKIFLPLLIAIASMTSVNAQDTTKILKSNNSKISKKKVLTPNMAQEGDKEIRTDENGTMHFGSDVTRHSKPTPNASKPDLSKGSKVDPRVKENERKRAAAMKKKK